MNTKYELTYPELMIENLNKKIIELLKECFANGYKTDILKALLKKLWTLQILDKRYIIAVSGLQNVGKTTLMKIIYKIPDEYIPENQGRGEKIPVLITEEAGLKQFKTCSINIIKENDYVAVKTIDISADKFKKEALEPSMDCIMLELKVPTNFFGGKGKSFILLPGIEEIQSEWQDILRLSLIGSASCVFMFNSTDHSSFKNKEIIDKEIREGFKEAKPLFILSKSDQSKDNNEGLRQTVITDFGLENESDRIICTGLEYTSEWIEKFKKAINNYSGTTKIFRRRQIEHLKDILKQLDICLKNVEDQIRMNKIKEEISEEKNNVEKVNKVLRDATNDLKVKFLNKLTPELNIYAGSLKKKMADFIIEKDIFQKIKEVFVGKSLKDQEELNRKIESVWNDNDPGQITYNAIAQVINESVDGNFKKITSEKNQAQKLLASPENDEKLSLPVETPRDKFKRDIIILRNLNANKDWKLSDKFEKNLKYLPILLLTEIFSEYYYKNFVNVEPNPIKSVNIQETIDSNLSKAMSTIKENVVPIAALILAADGASDGKFDIPENLAKAFGGVEAISPELGWAIAALAALYLTVDTVQRINKYELEEKFFADSVINSFKDSYLSYVTDKYDDMMDKLVIFVTEKMREYYHLDKNLGRTLNLIKVLADTKNSVYEIKQMLPVLL